MRGQSLPTEDAIHDDLRIYKRGEIGLGTLLYPHDVITRGCTEDAEPGKGNDHSPARSSLVLTESSPPLIMPFRA